MYFPYEVVETQAKKTPPPQPPQTDEFPFFATVTALYIGWVLLFSRSFKIDKFTTENTSPGAVRYATGSTRLTAGEMRVGSLEAIGVENAKATIKRINGTKLIYQLHQKWRFAKTEAEKKKWAGMAWDSHEKNLLNTVYGTCAEAVGQRELAKMPASGLIKWLPSVAHDIDLIHMQSYYKVMTVKEALKRGLCVRIGCKCGWSKV